MYGRYIKEHRGDYIIENEKGFATYRIINNGTTVYIIDIYILPDFRHDGSASAIADQVVEAAKLQGCTELLGTVVPSAHNSNDSLKVLLAYGMTLQSSANDIIVFRKEI